MPEARPLERVMRMPAFAAHWTAYSIARSAPSSRRSPSRVLVVTTLGISPGIAVFAGALLWIGLSSFRFCVTATRCRKFSSYTLRADQSGNLAPARVSAHAADVGSTPRFMKEGVQ
jgi:hypothetical protein